MLKMGEKLSLSVTTTPLKGCPMFDARAAYNTVHSIQRPCYYSTYERATNEWWPGHSWQARSKGHKAAFLPPPPSSPSPSFYPLFSPHFLLTFSSLFFSFSPPFLLLSTCFTFSHQFYTVISVNMQRPNFYCKYATLIFNPIFFCLFLTFP